MASVAVVTGALRVKSCQSQIKYCQVHMKSKQHNQNICLGLREFFRQVTAIQYLA